MCLSLDKLAQPSTSTARVGLDEGFIWFGEVAPLGLPCPCRPNMSKPADPSWQNPGPLLAAEAMRVHLRCLVNILNSFLWQGSERKSLHIYFFSSQGLGYSVSRCHIPQTEGKTVHPPAEFCFGDLDLSTGAGVRNLLQVGVDCHSSHYFFCRLLPNIFLAQKPYRNHTHTHMRNIYIFMYI